MMQEISQISKDNSIPVTSTTLTVKRYGMEYGYTSLIINHSLPNLLLLQCSFHTLSMPPNANAENSQHCDWNRCAISRKHTVRVAQTHSRSADVHGCECTLTHTHAHSCTQLCFGDAENKQLFCSSSTLHLPLS